MAAFVKGMARRRLAYRQSVADRLASRLATSRSTILLNMGPGGEVLQEDRFGPLIGFTPEELAAATFADADSRHLLRPHC